MEVYDNYLGLHFDGTQKSISILGNIYLGRNINNEIYTLKEMMAQLNKVLFEKVMYEEVKAMVTTEIWEEVSKGSIYEYYNDLKGKGCDIKHQ